MNTSNLIWLFMIILLMSCGTKKNDTNKSDEHVNTDSLTNVHSDSIKPSIEEPQSFESTFSVHDLFENQNSDVVNTIAQEDFELAIKKKYLLFLILGMLVLIIYFVIRHY